MAAIFVSAMLCRPYSICILGGKQYQGDYNWDMSVVDTVKPGPGEIGESRRASQSKFAFFI